MKLKANDYKSIYEKSLSGRTQASLANEYGVSQSRISRIIKAQKSKAPPRQIRGSSFAESWSTEQLLNRYKVVRQGIETIEEDKRARAEKVASLEKERRALSRAYAESDNASQGQIHRRLRNNQRTHASLQRQRHVDIELQDFLEEAAELVAELIVRNVAVPIAQKRGRYWI